MPMSLRSGPIREPLPCTRWQVAHWPLPSNSDFAARGVASGQRAGRAQRRRAQIRHDGAGIALIHVGLRRHARAGNAVADNLHDIVVRDGALELALQQVDAGDLVALGTMAVDAIVGVLPPAVFDIGRGVFVLRQQRAGAPAGKRKLWIYSSETQSSYCGRSWESMPRSEEMPLSYARQHVRTFRHHGDPAARGQLREQRLHGFGGIPEAWSPQSRR